MIPSRLLVAAYASGWFPMATDGEIRWYSPDPRGILPLDGFHIPRRLARVARQARFRIEIDRAFPDVIRACADDERDPDGSWHLDQRRDHRELRALHEHGIAHSVETWLGDRAGRRALRRGAGRRVLRRVDVSPGDRRVEGRARRARRAAARARLRAARHPVGHPHLEQFGAVEIPRADYLQLLEESLAIDCTFV